MAERAGEGKQQAAGPDSRCVLVVSTVHVAEDPRLRWRTVAALARYAPVRYATKPPGPERRDDHEWVPLRGGRLRRALGAARLAWRRDVAVVSLHDPELLPLALVLRLLRRVPVVFDVHEDIPAQIRTKGGVPRALRWILARVAAVLLRAAERRVTITLAEPNYARLFRREHPVLPNYPELTALPEPQPTDGSVVYVGDVTELRGARMAIEATALLDPPPVLRLIGRCEPRLAERLMALAEERGVKLELPGFLPHAEAMAITARAAVGLSPLTDIPNYRHSLPTKNLEYLVMGVPTVASDLPGTATALGGLEGILLLPPGDVNAWTRGIEKILEDPSMRAETAAQSVELRRRFRFRPESVWAVYRSVLGHDR